jgi:hypothetical protein
MQLLNNNVTQTRKVASEMKRKWAVDASIYALVQSTKKKINVNQTPFKGFPQCKVTDTAWHQWAQPLRPTHES